MEFLQTISFIGAIAAAIIIGSGYVFILYLCLKGLFEEDKYQSSSEKIFFKGFLVLLILALIGIPANELYTALHP